LTDSQKELIWKNGFVVSPTVQQQLFYIYEENDYLLIPNFVTTDAILQLYHTFYDYSLRNAEMESFLPALEKLTNGMADKLLKFEAADSKVNEAKDKALAYFSTAISLLEGAEQAPKLAAIPDRAKDLASKELALAKAAGGLEKSPLTGSNTYYSMFKIRGHYTRSEEFEKYFGAMMWYGVMSFPVYDLNKGVADLDAARVSFLISALLAEDSLGDPLLASWENVYSPTAFFVGDSDDLTPLEALGAITPAFGVECLSGEGWNQFVLALADDEKVADAAFRLASAREAKIQSDYDGTAYFRFMGQRYTPDSEILQKLSDAILRPVPSGLDVAAVLGSSNAKGYIGQYLKPEESWPAYPEIFAQVKKSFDSITDETWRSNMYHGWLWSLKPLLETPEDLENWPLFAQSSAWADKNLSAALASWAELKHDTVLYGKPSGAERGGGEETNFPGYVEPNIGVYERLLWLTDYSRESLEARGLLSESLKLKSESVSELLEFLLECSRKELSGIPLTLGEIEKIQYIGGTLENLSTSIATDGAAERWFEIESEVERNMAVAVDVHNTPNGLLSEMVGTAAEILAVVEHNGIPVLTRGAVFDYYESIVDTPYTDEEWQAAVNESRAPERPAWTRSYFTHIGSDIPKPNYEASVYLLEDSDSRLLTEADIDGMAAQFLRHARNEIYARHGRIFEAEDLQNYFNQQAWYAASVEADEFDESGLSGIERANIDFLAEAEKKME
jgi:hypothetical protein